MTAAPEGPARATPEGPARATPDPDGRRAADGPTATARRGRWRLVAFLAAFAVLTWALYAPRPPTGPPTDLPLDKVAHLLLFAAVTALGRRARIPAGWLLAVLVGQAVASELVQGRLIGTRSGDLLDLAADLLGIALGWVLGRGLARSRSAPANDPAAAAPS